MTGYSLSREHFWGTEVAFVTPDAPTARLSATVAAVSMFAYDRLHCDLRACQGH